MTEFEYIMMMHGDAIIAVVAMAAITYIGLFFGIFKGKKKSKELREALEKEDKARFSVLSPREHLGMFFAGMLSGISTTVLMPVVVRSFIPDLDIKILFAMCSFMGAGAVVITYNYLNLLYWRIKVDKERLIISRFRKEDRVVYYSDISYVKKQENDVNPTLNMGIAIHTHPSEKTDVVVDRNKIGYEQLIKRLEEKGVEFKED